MVAFKGVCCGDDIQDVLVSREATDGRRDDIQDVLVSREATDGRSDHGTRACRDGRSRLPRLWLPASPYLLHPWSRASRDTSASMHVVLTAALKGIISVHVSWVLPRSILRILLHILSLIGKLTGQH